MKVNEENENASPAEQNENPEQEDVEAPKKHHKKAKASIVQTDKLDPHSADAIGNAGDNIGDSADQSIDVDKEKAPAPVPAKPAEQEQ